jgi:hypothetical protein
MNHSRIQIDDHQPVTTPFSTFASEAMDIVVTCGLWEADRGAGAAVG